MNAAVLIHLLTGLVVVLFFTLFARDSIKENKYRAFYFNIVSLLVLITFWIGYYILFNHTLFILLLPSIVIFIVATAFFFLFSKNPSDIGSPGTRFDERDVMFAREEYQPGTSKYEEYYNRHPELQKKDDRIRALPPLLKEGGKFYDPLRSRQVDAFFELIEDLTHKVDGPTATPDGNIDPETASRYVKDTLLSLGADEVGIAELNPNYVYSHVGRGPEKWGEPIENSHKYVIVFSLEMAYPQVEKAPLLNITEETVRGYFNGALISTALAEAVRNIGYPARAHIAGSNYQVILPGVAYDAGLGELGRFGYLISRKFGARIRLGAVTTDLPLIPARPVHFGVREFCMICKKCAVNCPSRAIPFDGPVEVRGVRKWPLNVARCITYWRLVGTDCGLCMKVCPFSHPQSIVHNTVRRGIARSPFARRLSKIGDDILYGRTVPKKYLNDPAVY